MKEPALQQTANCSMSWKCPGLMEEIPTLWPGGGIYWDCGLTTCLKCTVEPDKRALCCGFKPAPWLKPLLKSLQRKACIKSQHIDGIYSLAVDFSWSWHNCSTLCIVYSWISVKQCGYQFLILTLQLPAIVVSAHPVSPRPGVNSWSIISIKAYWLISCFVCTFEVKLCIGWYAFFWIS